MYICICNAITDREIKAAKQRGVSTLDELSEATGVASCCGMCAEQAEQILAGDDGCGRSDCCQAA